MIVYVMGNSINWKLCIIAGNVRNSPICWVKVINKKELIKFPVIYRFPNATSL